ncbi:MAG TPA: DUF6325 family protein [Chloroflexota bacterium]
MHTVGVAPLEVVAVEFPGYRFRGEVLAALNAAADCGAIRIIDVTFIRKDAAGVVTRYELMELPEPELAHFDLVDEIRGLLSVGDIARIGADIAVDSSAAVMVLEHVWKADLERAIAAAYGRIALNTRVPDAIAEAALRYECGAPKVHEKEAGSCSDAT